VGSPKRESTDGGSASLLTLPGLLNALDGVGAVDGRLLFMTCHRATSLEPALVRPGRIDMRVGFGAPDRAQAAALFRHFFYGAPARNRSTHPSAEKGRDDDSARSSPKKRQVAFGGAPPPMDRESLDRLAERFADNAVRSMWDLHPDGSEAATSMAGLQGHLMMHREDPEGAINSL
jgi:chaperone BCS1